MKRILRIALLGVAASSLGGCYYYGPYAYGPYPPYISGPSAQQRFDRSWDAVVGAMADQGVAIATQDRGAGVVRGTRGTASVTASVQTQADGDIQVRFDQSGPPEADPQLIHRISASYDRRMGR